MAYIPNLSFSVADTDRIIDLARRHYSPTEIANDFALKRRFVTHEQIASICAEQRVYVRRWRKVST